MPGTTGVELLPSLGSWSARPVELKAMVTREGYGPRSGRAAAYESMAIGLRRVRLMVSNAALLGVFDGQSAWGASGQKAGQLVV